MIQSIIRFSVDHKWNVLIITFFLIVLSIFSIKNIPIDVIPDLSEKQVIIYSKWDRNPSIIEDQVTYPIISAMLGTPKVKTVRGITDYGSSFVYVIFEEDTDLYWARSRVLEYLSSIQSKLPKDVDTSIGPDATGVGWIYQYIIHDTTSKLSLDEMRSIQDFKLKFLLQSVQGVSEVASVGGYRKQYQIRVDPNQLIYYNISMKDIIEIVRESNNEVSGRLLEVSGIEFMVQGYGYIKSLQDLENIVVKLNNNGTPVYLKNVAEVRFGPEFRRGITDYNGKGEVTGGIIVMRNNENALEVIDSIKEKISLIADQLPKGIEIVPIYDRSIFIRETIDSIFFKLIEEIIIVSIIIIIFLWHFPSAIVPVITIPLAILFAFIPLHFFGIGSNLMTLAGIAISIGVLVDGSIVEVENAYRKIEDWDRNGRIEKFEKIRLDALLEVGPSVFFSLLVIAVAFIPIFALENQEGKMFIPLAWSKNITMFIAAVLAITVDPVIRMSFSRIDPFHFRSKLLSKFANTVLIGKYRPEEDHPITKRLLKFYSPIIDQVLKRPKAIIASSLGIILLTIPLASKIGTEFMPPLYEGNILYMPTTLPGLTAANAESLLMEMDRRIIAFPEVEKVLGKAGRADTATDPSPLTMFETIIILKPVQEWRDRTPNCDTIQPFPKFICDSLPNFIPKFIGLFMPTKISQEELVSLLNAELDFPGVSNAWTMPIRARIDMLNTGFRTPIGIKILGDNIENIDLVGQEIQNLLVTHREIRSVFAERTLGGNYIDIIPNRIQMARYGISLKTLQEIISSAIGGETITESVEGRNRFSVNIRYPYVYRDSPRKLETILIPSSNNGHIPLGDVASIQTRKGAAMIRNDNGFIAGYVYIDTNVNDIDGLVTDLKALITENISLPESVFLEWSGQSESIIRVRKRLMIIVPFTILLILFLLYKNTGSIVKTGIVFLAVPFSLVGAVFLIWFLGYQWSVAVLVGMIALIGLDAETGVFMLMYLDLSLEEFKKNKSLNNVDDLKSAIHHGAVKRIRPKIMTVLSAFLGLLPIMWSIGPGSDMMKRIAAPLVGGIFSSFFLELLIYPAIYYLWHKKILFGNHQSN
ncbi:efflux RND transporter permease subunit [Leptospira sp. GIMC2001]|uniref:efflux RND transporter permease subunit n=1 Tax=Leptospira sp. GIMC2001 TaxID=1513297 RepID=UPI0004A5C2E1|nr:efflux RND transporter permease subunit [Leptospira sp. GIMC2001]AID56177.1 cobalt-zinc-cadmium resistance protein CzcA [Leptospira sp. GIMC2001]WCL50466.1 efflux RND transporter permease subunit [Leptospira sp. GIMC2001]